MKRAVPFVMIVFFSASLAFAQKGKVKPTPAISDDAVWAEVKEAACPTNQTTDLAGLSPLVCHKGRGTFEFGTSCLYIVTSKGAQATQVHRDLSCVEGCPGPDWTNDIPCDSKGDIVAFKGKTYFRNFAALPSDARDQMNQDMSALKALVTAKNAKSTASYDSLGGDAKRKAVQQDIVKIVMEQMLPFAWSMRPTDDIHWIYELDYSGPVSQSEGVNPFEWFGDSNFEIHESAFYIKEKSGNLRSEDPDIIAATLLHEFLVHSRQFNSGNGEASAQGKTDPLLVVEDSMSEVVAYTVSKSDPFYEFALSPDKQNELGDKQITFYTTQFNENWPKLTQASKEQAAAWAWYCSNYMKNQLSRASLTSGGGALAAMALMGVRPAAPATPTIWSEVCSAVKSGGGMCNLATKKPASDDCLKKQYF